MSAQTLDGMKIRDEIFAELKQDISRHHTQGIRPGLAAVLVGENPASHIYVKSKIAACEQLGMAHWLHSPPGNVSTDYMLQLVASNFRFPRRSIPSAFSKLSIPQKTSTASIP
jgi:methylenetetrahydrofolate dehydrogenase (NADP+) / methenyltetrahydrofolate cyclohydrolase